MKKLLIEKLDHEGRGITYIDDKITFVENSLPEEIVDIEITKKKTKCNIAEVTKYHQTSSKRIEPICPYFSECGGCDLLHLSYGDTIIFKKNKLNEILSKYADLKLDIEVIENKFPLFYRNKISLKIIDKKIGFYKKETHDLIEIEKCYITKESINDFLLDIPLLGITDGEITIRSNYNNELLIIINTPSKINIDYEEVIKKHKIVGIILNNKTVYGKSFFLEKVNNLFFQVSYNSFFQVNEYINSKVLDIIGNINFSNKKVLDLYCGVGGLGMATHKTSEKVYGIELVENAIIDAMVNIKLNKLKNFLFFKGNASQVLSKIPPDFDYIILDPPRGGLNKDTMYHIEDINPKNIIYMSCEPITLARDLKWLKNNYTIEKTYLLDMFSYTHHIECMVLLNRK